MSNDIFEQLDELEKEEDTRVYSPSNIEGMTDFYKESEECLVWWIESIDQVGEHLFSFDRKKIYNLFMDYPQNLTAEEKEIFDRENPFWRDFLN